jgi:light-regulated signal transduction histidine kinase (bacteriophytochrome)
VFGTQVQEFLKQTEAEYLSASTGLTKQEAVALAEPGIGLSMAQGIVQQQGGAITAQSIVGKVSAFLVESPLQSAASRRFASQLAATGDS